MRKIRCELEIPVQTAISCNMQVAGTMPLCDVADSYSVLASVPVDGDLRAELRMRTVKGRPEWFELCLMRGGRELFCRFMNALEDGNTLDDGHGHVVRLSIIPGRCMPLPLSCQYRPVHRGTGRGH